MKFECDWCGEQFEDPQDCSGDPCNRCEEGIMQDITDEPEGIEFP